MGTAGGTNRRRFLALSAGAATTLMAGRAMADEAEETETITDDGVLDEAAMKEMLASMGLKAKKVEKRFDFAFKAKNSAGEDWKLSMSTVLSQNGRSIWVMAWLDRIPSSAADVPRTALLRLMALNDRMGKGKFFAYIPTNKRFVLQRVIPNRGVSNRAFQAVLQDLGYSVVETYPHWSVANWSPSNAAQQTAGKDADPSTTRRAALDSKFSDSVVR